MIGGIAGYTATKKVSQLEHLNKVRAAYSKATDEFMTRRVVESKKPGETPLNFLEEYGIPQLLAEIELERKPKENAGHHFRRIQEHVDRLHAENEMHKFCIEALRKQIERSRKKSGAK